MENFIYCAPTKVIFGKNVISNLANELLLNNAKQVLIVYGSNRINENGLLGSVENMLINANIKFITFNGVKANPTVEKVREGVKVAKMFKVDFILAIGGGSVIDTAKAISVGALTDVDVWDIWTAKESFNKALPVACVLTIPAAGSEMSNSAVLTSEQLMQKRGLGSELFRLKFAIMDPTYAMTLPKKQIACGVTDILMHTLDRYFYRVEKQNNNLTDSLAEAILKVVMKFGLRAYNNPSDYEAMSEIMWASSLSHNDLTGLGGDRDFSVHQLGHELSAMFDIPHGESLSCMWASWARYVMDKNLDRFIRFANMVLDIKGSDRETALAGIKAMEDFFKLLDMPISLAEFPFAPLDERTLFALAIGCSRNGTREVGSFYLMTTEDMLKIYISATE